MNRKLLALAVGTALSLPLAAQAAPSVYGQLNLSVDKVSTNAVIAPAPVPVPPASADSWQVNSNSSRLGVMGEEALGSGLSAVYKAEWAVSGDVAGNPNSATNTDLVGRDRYLGLKGSFGTVRLGAYDSPLKTSQGMVDQFNDMTYTDMANFILGDNRLDNAIGYTSPKLADVITLNAVIQPGEGAGADSRLANAYSLSAVFESGGIYAAAAYDSDVTNGGYAAVTGYNTVRLTGGYTMDALQFGILLQRSALQDDGVIGIDPDTQTAFLLSAAFSLDEKNVVKAQIISTKDTPSPAFIGAPVNDEKTMVLEVGYDHNFTKMTKAYAQAGYAKTDVGAGPDQKDSVLTVGMLTKF